MAGWDLRRLLLSWLPYDDRCAVQARRLEMVSAVAATIMAAAR